MGYNWIQVVFDESGMGFAGMDSFTNDNWVEKIKIHFFICYDVLDFVDYTIQPTTLQYFIVHRNYSI